MSTVLGPDGKRAASDGRCANPRCRASRDRRENAAGFGPPVWICGVCGQPVKEDE